MSEIIEKEGKILGLWQGEFHEMKIVAQHCIRSRHSRHFLAEKVIVLLNRLWRPRWIVLQLPNGELLECRRQ